MVPIIKLPLDLFLIDWSSWAILYQIHPWACPKGTRTFSVGFGYFYSWLSGIPCLKIGFSVFEKYSFSIADVLAYFAKEQFLVVFSLVFLFITCFVWIRGILRLYQLHKISKKILSESKICSRTIFTKSLAQTLRKCRIPIYVNHNVGGSPFLLGVINPSIVFPKSFLDKLSTVEFEATVAHEIEHVKNYDPLSRLICILFTTLFWWVPSFKSLKSIFDHQEMACDKAATHYIAFADYAALLVDIAKQAKTSKLRVGVHLINESSLSKRVNNLLTFKKHNRLQKTLPILIFGVSVILLFSKLWWL